jgi:hypothetical protein
VLISLGAILTRFGQILTPFAELLLPLGIVIQPAQNVSMREVVPRLCELLPRLCEVLPRLVGLVTRLAEVMPCLAELGGGSVIAKSKHADLLFVRGCRACPDADAFGSLPAFCQRAETSSVRCVTLNRKRADIADVHRLKVPGSNPNSFRFGFASRGAMGALHEVDVLFVFAPPPIPPDQAALPH